MADFNQDTYQPMDGDLYIQEVRAGRFTIYRYSFQSWEQLGAGHSEQDIKAMIAPMQLLGESAGHRRYYRPTGQAEARRTWKLIDKAQLALKTQIELFEGGKLLLTDESEDPFLPTFIELDAEGAIKLGGFLLSHQDYLNKHRDAKQDQAGSEEDESDGEWVNGDEEDEELIEGDGSGLHQCQYCYNLVSKEHEEFCRLNPNRNRNIVP